MNSLFSVISISNIGQKFCLKLRKNYYLVILLKISENFMCPGFRKGLIWLRFTIKQKIHKTSKLIVPIGFLKEFLDRTIVIFNSIILIDKLYKFSNLAEKSKNVHFYWLYSHLLFFILLFLTFKNRCIEIVWGLKNNCYDLESE